MITEGPLRWGGGVRARDTEAEGNLASPSPPSTTCFTGQNLLQQKTLVQSLAQ